MRDLLSIWFERILKFFGLKEDSEGLNKEQSNNIPTTPFSRHPTRIERQTEFEIGADEPPEYRKSKSILTYRERAFYYTLIRAIEDDQYRVFAKVRLADFFWLANEPKNRKYHRNQILCKHVDFLICERSSLAPVLGIELDDSSHKQPENRERDEFKNDLFSDTGLPLLRLDIQPTYSSRAVRQQIELMLPETPPFSESDISIDSSGS